MQKNPDVRIWTVKFISGTALRNISENGYLKFSGSSQLTTNRWVSSGDDYNDTNESLYAENCDRESQSAWIHSKDGALEPMNDSRHRPSDPNTQEHVNRIWARDVPNRIVRVFVLDGGNFGGECI